MTTESTRRGSLKRLRIIRSQISAVTITLGVTLTLSCNEKDSIDQPTSVNNSGKAPEESEKTGSSGTNQKKTEQKQNKQKAVGSVSDSSEKAEDDGETQLSFSICNDGLKKNEQLASFGAQVKILCDEGYLDSVLAKENIYSGGDKKLFEKNKKVADLQTSFVIFSGGAYDAVPEEYWSLLRLQFIKPAVFRQNYLNDPNAKMSNVLPEKETVSYRYTNNSGEGGLIDYNAKTVFITLKPGKAWVAASAKTGPTIETMEEMRSLQVVFASDSYPGKTALVSISDQTYKHASGQGQSYFDRAMNNLVTEQKNGFTNAKTATKAKGLLGE